MLQVENSIAASLQHFEFVVEPFDKPAICPANEVICDLLPPVSQCLQKIVKALQSAFLDSFDPGLNLDFSHLFGRMFFKDSCQLLAQTIG